MFNDYSDVVTPNEMCKMLLIGKSTGYELLRKNIIPHIRIGAKYVIPKQAIVSFIESHCEGNTINGEFQTAENGA